MKIKDDFLKEIGIKISEFRESKKQKQSDLSFLTGIEKSEISRYEQGKINLTMTTLLKFSNALDVHPRDFFDFEFDLSKYQIDGSEI
ncbi:putative transcriptional regulator [Galbibacter orientalis DSM 19592]|uniref:Putative transcriptional regulator n=1 Tax=Galbibacter orientalis DSM 19592 TaxID=926559 RepID=I3CAQ3_9FLAO|nr:helix-turn-helix transcriptional regulator [Galbibacter orientalis]EIJ40696.1 putative transcriptional regulator [Galbibacter orientalis DSM 19592]